MTENLKYIHWIIDNFQSILKLNLLCLFFISNNTREAIVHLIFWAGSTFSVSVCTVPSSMDRTSQCNKVDAVRLYASYRLNLLLLKGIGARIIIYHLSYFVLHPSLIFCQEKLSFIILKKYLPNLLISYTRAIQRKKLCLKSYKILILWVFYFEVPIWVKIMKQLSYL